MLEKLTIDEIEALLHRQVVGRLGCHADDLTYIVPISYAYDGQSIYCHSYEGKKLEILRKNPKVCFQVDDTKDMSNWKSVLAWGDFEELKDKNDREKALEILLKRSLPLKSSVTTHLGSQWPFSPDNVSDIKGIVFRIRLHERSGRFESTQLSPLLPG